MKEVYYLKKVMAELPAAKTVEQIEALLPWNVALGSAVPVGFN